MYCNKNMWLGFVAGVFYAATSRYNGNPPRLACTFGPFREGVLHYKNKPIHHWMLAAPCSVLSLILGSYDFAAFCVVMTLHGLSFSDTVKLPDVEEIDDVGDLDSDAEIDP